MNHSIDIIAAPWIIPIRPSNTVLNNHSVVIKDGQITDICEFELAKKNYPNANITERSNHVLMPGLINAHTHSPMSLFRGMADDLPLMDWLNNHIWPAEAAWVNRDFVRDGSELAIAEMLLSGTTCFNDMYFSPDIVAKTAQDIGIRAVVGLIVIDFPTVWANDADEYLNKGLAVHDETHSLSLVTTALAPHAPYTVSDAPLEKIRLYADELNIPIHMHLHETAHEVAESMSLIGQRPIARLNELGLLTPRLLAVHMTQLNDDEIDLIAKQGVHVLHCPESNLKLNSGYCPVQKLHKAGANICLGTDSAASNNDLDMLSELQSASLLSKTVADDATALPAWQALEMATINAATALNLDHKIGSLEPGKAADLIAIDLKHPSTQPVYNPISQLVYSASREQVSDVWVHGKQLVNNKQLTTIDTDHVLQKAVQWGNKIATN